MNHKILEIGLTAVAVIGIMGLIYLAIQDYNENVFNIKAAQDECLSKKEVVFPSGVSKDWRGNLHIELEDRCLSIINGEVHDPFPCYLKEEF